MLLRIRQLREEAKFTASVHLWQVDNRPVENITKRLIILILEQSFIATVNGNTNGTSKVNNGKRFLSPLRARKKHNYQIDNFRGSKQE